MEMKKMSDERFDCIIVGGGLAGLTAANVLAGEGLEVLLVEKGNYSGAKNMTGGRLYSHSLEKVMPGLAASAPLERRIIKERLSCGLGKDMITVEYDTAGLTAPAGESYTVLRGVFDRWLADQAEEQGAMLVYGIRVDDLLVGDGKIYGVIAGKEEMQADVVILADGVNSLLGQKLGYKEALRPDQVTVGVKELIGLSKETINQRFNVTSGEGVAWIFSGCGEMYDGFLYTNKDSVAIGVTMITADIDKTENSLPQMLEDFKNNLQVAPLIEGGRLLEYSAHLIPEGGAAMLPKLYGDGVLLTGDAAALCANLGFTLRGMDLAMESGLLAARTVIAAKKKGDFSAQCLSAYQLALEEGFVMDCLKGGPACLAMVKAGGFRDDPLTAINAIMNKEGINR
jgi:electron transfer flavoprotein-quinone oxidoreductase